MRKAIALILILFTGCMSSVNVDKHPNLALPIYDSTSNVVEYAQIDQGYSVKYTRYGFNTEIRELSASLTTNKTVTFTLGGFNSTTPTNAINISLAELLKLLKTIRSDSSELRRH